MKNRSLILKIIINLLTIPLEVIAIVICFFLVIFERGKNKANKLNLKIESYEKGNLPWKKKKTRK